MPFISRCDLLKESILHVNCNSFLVPWDLDMLAHDGRLRRLEIIMGNENESIKLSKLALEEKWKISLSYDERLDDPWNHLDFWLIIWGNYITCFSPLWLFVCLRESIASLEGFEHEKGIIFSHDTFTFSQDIKKKGGTVINIYGHYVPENSSLFRVRNHVILEFSLLLQKVVIYEDNLYTNKRFHSSSLCLVWADLEGNNSDLISAFFDLSWYILRETFDRGRWKIIWDTLSIYDPHDFSPNIHLYIYYPNVPI